MSDHSENTDLLGPCETIRQDFCHQQTKQKICVHYPSTYNFIADIICHRSWNDVCAFDKKVLFPQDHLLPENLYNFDVGFWIMQC